MKHLFQQLCEKLTQHRFRKLTGYSDEEYGEFYWKCRICGKNFWNREKPKDWRWGE